jgi:hypothetical protein
MLRFPFSALQPDNGFRPSKQIAFFVVAVVDVIDVDSSAQQQDRRLVLLNESAKQLLSGSCALVTVTLGHLAREDHIREGSVGFFMELEILGWVGWGIENVREAVPVGGSGAGTAGIFKLRR